MANTGRKEHRCRGKTKKSYYKKRCPRKIEPDKYKQGVRCCKRHIDQEVEDDEASSTDGESGEDNTVSSVKSEDDVSSEESATTPQNHPAPIIYIGNSKQYADNPQTHSSSTGEPQQSEQTLFIPSGHSSVRGHEQGHTARQEAPNTQRTTQNQPSYNSPSSQNTRQFQQFPQPSRSSGPHGQIQRAEPGFADRRATQGQHQGPWQSSRSRHSEPPSQYKQSSQPSYSSGSYTTKPFGQYQSNSEPPSAHSPARRSSSMSYSRNRQTDFTYGGWRAAKPSEAAQAPPLDRPQVRPTNFINAAPPPSAYVSRRENQTRPTQPERRPPPSQDQTPDRASWRHSTPAPQPGPPTGQFSINVPSYGPPIPAVSMDRRPPTRGLDDGQDRRQPRVSAAQIQQQYATICEHWQHFSTGVENLLDMVQPE